MSDTFESVWRELHGRPLHPTAAAWAASAANELSVYRPAGFRQCANVFEAAVASSADSHRLNLWEPFMSVLPAVTLGNGDMLFLYVPGPHEPQATPAALLWNHERDAFEPASDDDVAEAEAALPRGSVDAPLRFARRSAFIVELLARGVFDLDLYLHAEQIGWEHPALLTNVRNWPPTAMYAMWLAFFSGNDAALTKVLGAAEQSEARWIKDSAALIRELLAGRSEVGALKKVGALRVEVARTIADPAVAARAANARRRADLDRRLLATSGPVRLVRDDAEGAPATLVTEASLGDLSLHVVEQRPGRFRLVLRSQGRALSAMALRGTGGAPEYAPAFAVVQGAPTPVVALVRPANAAAPMAPNNGLVTVVCISGRRLVQVTGFELDVERLDHRDGALIARAGDGVGYRVVIDGELPAPQALAPLPGRPVEEPGASPPLDLGGNRVELTASALVVSRGTTVLFEEPMTDAYALAVVPARRMVAIHKLDFELRPTVDVYWVRPLTGPVAAGEGCCSWIAFPMDGLDVRMASTNDALFVHDGRAWIEIDAAKLTEVPSWIKARGWLA